MKIFTIHPDFNFSVKICERIEAYWHKWKQPLLLLAFILHLKYKLMKF